HPTDRLSVRIACRTAVWPSAVLEAALCRIWGEPAVGVFELAPLRRRDVVAGAEVSGLALESFSVNCIRQCRSVRDQTITAQSPASLFKKDGRLPRSVAKIYFRG